jgi:hypothetical protein
MHRADCAIIPLHFLQPAMDAKEMPPSPKESALALFSAGLLMSMRSNDDLAKLLRSCGLSEHAHHLSTMARPQCVRALDMCFSPSFEVGASGIDAALGGGMFPGLLYEVVGPGGSGKTQFGLQCLLQSLLALPPTSICAYICAEKSVPMLRLRSMSAAFAARHALTFDPLDRLYLHTAHSFRELEGIVLTQLPSLPSRSRLPAARLACVVIDSVCGFSRDLDEQWLGAEAAQMRAAALGRMAQVTCTRHLLLRLCFSHRHARFAVSKSFGMRPALRGGCDQSGGCACGAPAPHRNTLNL